MQLRCNECNKLWLMKHIPWNKCPTCNGRNVSPIQPIPIAPIVINNTPIINDNSGSNDSFATSLAVGLVTGDPGLGMMAGGDIVGAEIGAMIADSNNNSCDYSNSNSSNNNCDDDYSCDSGYDNSPSDDSGSSSYDSGSSDCGSSSSDW